MKKNYLLVCLAFVISHVALAQQSRRYLAGWGPFAFNMDVDAAKKAGGPAYAENEYRQLTGRSEVGDMFFEVRVMFRQGQDRIKAVVLTRKDVADLDAPACERAATDLEYIISSKYGDPDKPKTLTIIPVPSRVSEVNTRYEFQDGASIIVDAFWKGTLTGGSFGDKCSMFIAYNEPVKVDKQGF